MTTDASALSALRERPAARGIAWMVLASFLFAMMNVLARVASSHVPWPEVAATRSIVGVLVALTLSRASGSSLRVQDQRRAWLRTIFGTGALLSTFYVLSARSVPVGDVVTLGATSPVFIALLSPLVLRERVGGRVWLATPLAFAGVIVIVQPSFDVAGPVAAVATLAAVFSALAMMWLRKLGPGESSEAIVLHFSLFAAVCTIGLSLFDLRLPDARGAVSMVAAGLMGGLAQISMTRAYALDRAARIGAVGYVGIVFTQLLAVPILGEAPLASQAVGSALVVGAGLLLAAGAWSEGAARA